MLEELTKGLQLAVGGGVVQRCVAGDVDCREVGCWVRAEGGGGWVEGEEERDEGSVWRAGCEHELYVEETYQLASFFIRVGEGKAYSISTLLVLPRYTSWKPRC